MKIPLEILGFLSLTGFFLTLNIIPNFRESFIRGNLFGIDLNKRNSGRIPEAGGVLAGCVFLVITILGIPFAFVLPGSSEEQNEELSRVLAALLSVASMLLLGFADDVLDLRWRHKLALPSVASLPLLIVYYVTVNKTFVMVPPPFGTLIGPHLDLGLLYYLYIGLLAVFCTNAINILSGINGLEVGQALVIASSVAIFNFREIHGPFGDYHRFSLYFLIPFIATGLALLYHNWYPATVFCGDTFCYFSGMTLAVVAILGHFSKTLLLFFVPQILNFLYSLPQLARILPCPRHRLPKYNPETDKIYCSSMVINERQTSVLGRTCIKLLESFKLGKVRRDSDGTITCNNLTLVNLVLFITGPMREETLTIILLVIQALFSVLAFFIRYPVANLFYGEVVA